MRSKWNEEPPPENRFQCRVRAARAGEAKLRGRAKGMTPLWLGRGKTIVRPSPQVGGRWPGCPAVVSRRCPVGVPLVSRGCHVAVPSLSRRCPDWCPDGVLVRWCPVVSRGVSMVSLFVPMVS